MLCFDKLTIKTLLGHKKLIICFLGTARVTFNPRIKNFYSVPTSKCEKSSTHCELSVQSGRHLPCFLLSIVGLLLNSGTPALVIWHHLLKVGNFYGTSSEHCFYSQKVKKIKIKSRPPASFSEKKGLRNI